MLFKAICDPQHTTTKLKLWKWGSFGPTDFFFPIESCNQDSEQMTDNKAHHFLQKEVDTIYQFSCLNIVSCFIPLWSAITQIK